MSLSGHSRVILTAALLAAPCVVVAQNAGVLRGTITDPAGAAVADATVTVTSFDGKNIEAKSNKQGVYEVRGLAPGKYTVNGVAQGFAVFTNPEVDVTAGLPAKLDIHLEIAVEQQQVTVEGETPAVSVDAESNATATVLKGKDLEALSDDPDELSDEISALAGPSSGPNGGQIYIDGFTAGQLPPKSSIREIRVNQNPFSAQYDKAGYGRVEIFTKPGTDQYHGQAFILGNMAGLNSKNPFYPNEPGYDSEQYNASVGGPLNKRASFFFNIDKRNINQLSLSNPTTSLDASGHGVQTPFTLPDPERRWNISPRLDYQVTQTNTLTARYQYLDQTEQNSFGGYSLPSAAQSLSNTEHQFQMSDTQVLGAKVVNETRFQFLRDDAVAKSLSGAPTISVLGAFTGGGNASGNSDIRSDNYEFQNYTSIAQGKHFIRVGGRVRISDQASLSTAGFNGTYTFASLQSYFAGTPDQFSITQGSPAISNTMVDAGLYAEDDWKLRPNLTVSSGLRFESQNNINDHGDWAPRIGIAWGVGGGKGGSPKTVIRAGYGIFYDRFSQNYVLSADRLNGVTQQEFVMTGTNIPYPTFPAISQLTGSSALTRYLIDSRLHAPYVMQTAIGLERQLGKMGTISTTYINSRGVHQLLSRNINAPLPGTFDPAVPDSGVYPYGAVGNIYQYQSEGIFKQNQWITNVNLRLGQKFSVFGFYTLGYANSDTTGAISFPMHQYDLSQDYGRTSFDIRNRLFVGGSFSLPWYFRVSPFLVAQSGQPYTITVGSDANGDSILNDRPALGGEGIGKNVTTALGTFNLVPAPGGSVIGPYSQRGPALVTLNMRVSKTFGFGEKKGGESQADRKGGGGRGRGNDHGMGGPRGMGNVFGSATTDNRYNLTFSASARNLLNHVNYAPPHANLSNLNNFDTYFAVASGGGFGGSSLFNRRIDLQMSLNF